MNILVSACLLGVDCRYCGTGICKPEIIDLKKEHNLIPICPEQLGGMPTPRDPVEIMDGKALDKERHDFTKEFEKGAIESLKIAKILECKTAILKSNSPSCGSTLVYDGTFRKKLIKGKGFAAKLLEDNGIKVFDENQVSDISWHKYTLWTV